MLVEGELLTSYNVVDRSNLNLILDEQRLSLSGLFADENAVKAGCLAGAEGTVIISHDCIGGSNTTTIKMLDCSTSGILWTATGKDRQLLDLIQAVKQELARSRR